MKTVVINRGLPGSGKSTRARRRWAYHTEVRGHKSIVVSADDYFMQDGKYVFNGSKIRDAHAQCFSRFLDALLDGHDLVIVDNTNTQVWEFENYIRVAKLAGYDIVIDETIAKDSAEIEMWCKRCTHGVPLDKMKQMHQRWEPFDIAAWQAQFKEA